jgi:hypothetical protein
MADFTSYRSYWDFAESVIREWRYTRTAEQEEFLATVILTSEIRREVILKDEILWRAQIGNDWKPVEMDGEPEQEECPFPPERMKPLRHQASEGRANPKGLPYLYLSSEIKTAVAEVRPWVGALVSVAEMKVTKPLTIVNCSKEEPKLMLYGHEPSASERERAVWRDINIAFSRPVTQNDLVADYIPTQILAETFRKHGFDGISYKSSLGSGGNLVLFDLDAVKLSRCILFKVDSVSFAITDLDQYFMRGEYSSE